MDNISNAVNWISKGSQIKIENGELAKCSMQERLGRFFSKKQSDQDIQQVSAHILSKLQIASPDERQSLVALADSFIRHNQKAKGIHSFDRTVAAYRSELGFVHKGNSAGFRKWMESGRLPADVFQKYPEFCNFLEASKIRSQMKVTRDTLKVIDDEPAILVEGSWMKWSQLKETFEYAFSGRHQEIFVVHKEMRHIYTYLDNGRGLELHHPYRSEYTPISTRDEEEYEAILAQAQTFVRPGEEGLSLEERAERNKDRTFILQLVTSQVEGPKTNLHNLLVNRKHPYLRVVIGKDNPKMNTFKGEVYEVGFGWLKKMRIPLVTTQGQFRSPDAWEYMPCDKKIVTSMPITQEEAAALSTYTTKYHRNSVNLGNPIGFHILRQNCSSYARAALNVAGIKVPTEIPITAVIKEITPDWIKAIGAVFKRVKDGVEGVSLEVLKWTPQCVRDSILYIRGGCVKIAGAIAKGAAAMSIAIIRLPLGAAAGKGGQAFVEPDAQPRAIVPDAADWKAWFRLSSYRINLPAVLQRWQLEQASTFARPYNGTLAIVP
ncbi:MAG: hypothetical protein E6Q59_01285 [Nitrosomonas sp.]|nr:MAG: hypothetical protein E6Q59_01285 [Nitrosomonas sp.]